MKKIILSVDGMTCSACSSGLEKYLNKQKGILSSSVNLVLANVTVEYDETILNIQKIEEFIKKAGFKSLGEFKEIKVEKKTKKEKITFITFTFLAIFLLYLSMGHMIHLSSLPYFDPNENTVNYMIALLILTVLFLIYGFDILKNGYKNLIHFTPNMDTLVGIGVITSFLYSLYHMYLVLAGDTSQIMNLYFESSSIVIYFVKLGRYLDGISKDKTKEAIQKLVTITPNQAVIKVNGKEKIVSLDEVQKGDILISKAGDKIAVDGSIVLGTAHFDDSFLTGESKPVKKDVGSKVLASSLNYDGYVEYKAEKIGKESMVSEIVRLVVEASNTKAPIAKLADKVSGVFVPVVLFLAVLSFLINFGFTKDFSVSLTSFVSVLVVACPCTLGLATPLAIVVSEGMCASHGILVKKNEVFESVSKINKIVFDKTGTLTYGKLKISKVYHYSFLEEDVLLQIVGSLEKKTTHPIGQVFVEYVLDKKLDFFEVDDFENLPGLGVKGMISFDQYFLGNTKMLKKYSILNDHLDDENKLMQDGNSIVYVVKNKEIIALIGVNDQVRENIKDVMKQLTKRKIETVMLTGDHEEVAISIAKEIGMTHVISNVLPKEKAEVIKDLKNQGYMVMMCGDGINDSIAISSSDIGVSIQDGTDVAMDSADVILMKNDLSSIITLIDISKKTVRIIKQNLFWAFFYNIFMIPIAFGVLKPFSISITPMMASFAMVCSSITVMVNTLRLKK